MNAPAAWAGALIALPLLLWGMSASGTDLARCQQKHSAATCYHALVR